MRKLLTTLLATAALGVAPVAALQAQDLRDTLGRALQGLQGDQNQRPTPEGYRGDDRRGDDRDRESGRRGEEGRYREGDRRYDERDTGRRGMRDADDHRRSAGDAERRLDEQQRRLDDERRRIEMDNRRPDRDRR
jgi:hypothetical protein